MKVKETELINAIKASTFLEIDLKNKLFGRKNKKIPKLRDRTLYITQDKNYERNEYEKKKGDKFSLFIPVVLELNSKKKFKHKCRYLEKVLLQEYDLYSPFIKTA